jgi:hypothetical protein
LQCLRDAQLDELWLPTPWQVDLFEEAKIGTTKSSSSSSSSSHGLPLLVYVPETVDGDYYSSSKVQEVSPEELIPVQQPIKLWNYSSPTFIDSSSVMFENKSIIIKEKGVEENGKRNKIINKEKRSKFTIVSVFKWGYRKGWDVLLEAYWRAFLDFDIPGVGGCTSLSFS